MKNIQKFFFLIIIAFFASCDLYPDWTEYVDYSDAYPICGEYMVRDFNVTTNELVTDWYSLYLYNKSYNPTKDSIWVDNRTGHPAGISNYQYKFKIKCKADTVNLTFDVEKAGDVVGAHANPLDTCVNVTISNSKIFRLAEGIEDPTPDSIYLEFTYFNEDGVQVRTLMVAGHRKTGWEFPNYDDPM